MPWDTATGFIAKTFPSIQTRCFRVGARSFRPRLVLASARRPHPRSNQDYWHSKLERNAARDAEHQTRLTEVGWDVLVPWECDVETATVIADRIREFFGEAVEAIRVPFSLDTHSICTDRARRCAGRATLFGPAVRPRPCGWACAWSGEKQQTSRNFVPARWAGPRPGPGRTGKVCRRFCGFTYRTQKCWFRARRVIAKAEAPPGSGGEDETDFP